VPTKCCFVHVWTRTIIKKLYDNFTKIELFYLDDQDHLNDNVMVSSTLQKVLSKRLFLWKYENYQLIKDPVCFVIVVVYHSYVKLHMYIIILIQQFSNIEEYVKYVLQICKYLYRYINVLIETFDLEFIENQFLNTSLYLHEKLKSVTYNK
jgi:hypothetical protein